MLTSGDVLQNRYRIEELIAEGGMGAVYRATDTRLKCVVALKECRIPFGTANQALREKLIRQFEDEARLLANLRHHALPNVSDHFTENNGQFLVMEYIPGDDLMEMIERRGGAFPVDEVLEWADQLLDALEYLHDRQPPVFHRDIKPQNIKLTENGRIVLLDFGLAKWEASSVFGGTPSYVPLEQVMGQGTDQRSDLYSLAATMYHLMTGLQVAHSYTRFTEKPDRLSPANKVNRLVSLAIADVLTQALSLGREGRPASAAEMRRLLHEAGKQPAPAKENASPPVAELPVVKKEDQNESDEAEAGNLPYEMARASSTDTTLSLFEFETVTLDSKGEITNRRKEKARYFIEDLGGVTLEMVEIRGGTFMMGSPHGEVDRYQREGPQHQVIVPSFYMGRFAVTQAQWRVMVRSPKVNRDLNADPSHFKGNNRPAEQVSWEDAVEFCSRLSNKSGKTYRLPTEAEWEYACRAGTTTPFAFGETITPEIVNYNGNNPYQAVPKGLHREETIDVGSLGIANGFGLYDMHGNVWEWCMDNWHDNYNGAPTDGCAWDAGGSSARMVRGGSWYNNAHLCRSAFRHGSTPGFGLNYFGFRVVSVVRTR